jgi:SOS response regulatory protein OraA/RecX
VPTITALREAPRGRVGIELDGAAWRVVPVDVAARAGLAVGQTLHRPDLRLLRRELRRAEALAAAGRALRVRDLSTERLGQRLERSGVAPAARAEALEALDRAGLVDDARFARTRADALAARGYGDAAIASDLERQGVSSDLREQAIGVLEPERERARELVRQRGEGARTARYLAARGFGEEALQVALRADFANDP